MQSAENDGATFSNVADAITSVSSTILELSMMNSVDDFMKFYAYAEDKPLYVASETITNYLGQFVPTVGGKIASIMDDTVRKSYSSGDSGQLKEDADYFVQALLKKIPGARETLPAAVDLWGNEVSNGDPLLRAIMNTCLLYTSYGIGQKKFCPPL